VSSRAELAVLPEALREPASAEAVAEWLRAQVAGRPPGGAIAFDLSELDVEDASLCASLAAALRAVGGHAQVTLVAPPQVLAHTLYRIGATSGPRAIVIVNPRSELGTSS